jgi:hypothetical protein
MVRPLNPTTNLGPLRARTAWHGGCLTCVSHAMRLWPLPGRRCVDHAAAPKRSSLHSHFKGHSLPVVRRSGSHSAGRVGGRTVRRPCSPHAASLACALNAVDDADADAVARSRPIHARVLPQLPAATPCLMSSAERAAHVHRQEALRRRATQCPAVPRAPDDSLPLGIAAAVAAAKPTLEPLPHLHVTLAHRMQERLSRIAKLDLSNDPLVAAAPHASGPIEPEPRRPPLLPHMLRARTRSAVMLPAPTADVTAATTSQPSTAPATKPVIASLDTDLLLLPSPRYNSDGEELTWRSPRRRSPQRGDNSLAYLEPWLLQQLSPCRSNLKPHLSCSEPNSPAVRAPSGRRRRRELFKQAKPPRFVKNYGGNGWSNLELIRSSSDNAAAEESTSAASLGTAHELHRGEAGDEQQGAEGRVLEPLLPPPRPRSRHRRDATRTWSMHEATALPANPTEDALRAELRALL